jgi:hypothetical protein
MQMNFNLNNVSSALGRIVLLSSVCLAAGLVGCNHASKPSGDTQTAHSVPADSVLEEAVFAKSLAKDDEPEKPSNDFAPSETICLSLKLKGRPKTGIVMAKFYCEDELITDAKVDVATVNSGVLFSAGECTYVGFSLKHPKDFPVSSKYRAETFFNDKPIGTYKFSVVPAGDDAPSKTSAEALVPKS